LAIWQFWQMPDGWTICFWLGWLKLTHKNIFIWKKVVAHGPFFWFLYLYIFEHIFSVLLIYNELLVAQWEMAGPPTKMV
jgi:hypothetical protein